MRYVSTRGGVPPAGFSDVLLEGLASDGGLYVPETYPPVDAATLRVLRAVFHDGGYAALAYEVLRLYLDDIPSQDLKALCAAAYSTEVFGSEVVTPVSRVGTTDLWLAHLSNGPTAAFKDLAMQLLGRLFDDALTRRDTWLTVLGATSGDTGSAAEYALLGRSRVKVAILTPRGRMTPFQQAQMYTIDDPSILNVAIDGVFDDCQDLVKAVTLDAAFKARHHLGAVNSINAARMLAQVVYAIAAWIQVTTRDDERVSVAVPTGNFGDILSVHVARQMGLPVDALILATNENNILAEFFATGLYRPRSAADTHATSSPSMDISKASNLERFVFDLVGRDPARTADLFGRQIAGHGFFDLSDDAGFRAQRERYGIVAGTSTHADRLATIRTLWDEHRILIDPHTADGVGVARRLMASSEVTGPVIAYETALPVKFADTIVEAIGVAPDVPERFAGLMDAPWHVVDLPNDVDVLKARLETWLAEGHRDGGHRAVPRSGLPDLMN